MSETGQIITALIFIFAAGVIFVGMAFLNRRRGQQIEKDLRHQRVKRRSRRRRT
jgi:hypothetical protein